MRYLFVLLVLALVGCNEASQPKCEDINGLMVTNFDVVPDDYTGVAFICEEGKVNNLANFKDGKYDGVWRRWSDNGQLELEINWKDDKTDGVRRSWHENGQLKFEENHKEWKLEGLNRYWHENGQLKYEVNWKDGKITDDKVVYYNEDGAIYKTKYYEDGEEVRCEGDC